MERKKYLHLLLLLFILNTSFQIAAASAPLRSEHSVAFPPRINGAGNMQSYNWAGILITYGTMQTSQITEVWGDWTVPDISGSLPASDCGTFVGIGRYDNNNDLIQVGTGHSRALEEAHIGLGMRCCPARRSH